MHVFRIKSSLGEKELRKMLDGMDAVAISPTSVESIEELMLAKHLADKSIERKTNIARNEKYEFLLWLSAKRDIRRAREETEPLYRGEFLLVVFSDANLVLEKLSATKLPLGLKDDADPLRLEKISLSRI